MLRRRSREGMFWDCPACQGRLIGFAHIRRHVPVDFANELWGRARDEYGTQGRPCPSCKGSMLEVCPIANTNTPRLDVCTTCNMVWFDPGEFQELPMLPKNDPQEASPAEKQANMLTAFYQVRRKQKPNELVESHFPLLTVYGSYKPTTRGEWLVISWLMAGLLLALLTVLVLPSCESSPPKNPEYLEQPLPE